MARLALFTNPSATEKVDRIVSAFTAAGSEVEHVPADSAQALESAARDLVSQGCERMIVAGGDGTIHLAIQALATTPTILGVIPVGTGNDFLRAMGLTDDIEVAARRALSEPGEVDLLRVGDRWAASVATLGFSGDVNARANRMQWPRGKSRYTLSTVLGLPGLHAREIELELDGASRAVEATLMTIANTSSFGGGMLISPDADPTDGVADLTIVTRVGRVKLLRFFGKVFNGSHVDLAEVECLRATKVRIVTPDLDLWADGELITTSPAAIEVVPKALRLAGAGLPD
jgi:diacylglycerol kinase (ATP)